MRVREVCNTAYAKSNATHSSQFRWCVASHCCRDLTLTSSCRCFCGSQAEATPTIAVQHKSVLLTACANSIALALTSSRWKPLAIVDLLASLQDGDDLASQLTAPIAGCGDVTVLVTALRSGHDAPPRKHHTRQPIHQP